MDYRPHNPLIVQSDYTVLLEVQNPLFEAARDALAPFAELEKSPEHVHTYRITPLSLWNAAAGGLTAQAMVDALEAFSKFPVPDSVRQTIFDLTSRYGRLKLLPAEEGGGEGRGKLRLRASEPALLAQIRHHKEVGSLLGPALDPVTCAVDPGLRGPLKQALLKIGWPVEDLAGYVEGLPLTLELRSVGRSGRPFALRPYQQQAVDAFWAGGQARGGSGVVVLPCGAGKTLVGLAAMVRAQAHTLILTTSTTAVRQWIAEALERTTLEPAQIGEYTGQVKEIRPVTVTTYQILTHRGRRDEDYPHLNLLSREEWGLIIYDEVHLLPAPVFRITAEIQARRRLGLTATLVREDGREGDVFSLIGPKRFDVPWRDLERQGWIATASCYEIRVEMPEERRMAYAVADEREKFRIASENPVKIDVAAQLVAEHPDDKILVIGQYLEQLEALSQRLGAPLLTGKTPQRERERLFEAFRRGELPVLVVSKVANFSIDLPDASVAIQVSGTFGSRQEEAQRLGRILRPKANGVQARFYTLVSHETCEQEFALKRQMFLVEQGYAYEIRRAVDERQLGSVVPLRRSNPEAVAEEGPGPG